MAKNGYFCVYCNNALHNADRTICSHCREKKSWFRKLKSMKPPKAMPVVEESTECIYSVRGKCNNAFSLNLGSECKGNIRCKKKEKRAAPEERLVLRYKEVRKVCGNG